MGKGNNIPGNIFTMDGNAVHFPSASDHFPDIQTNVVPIYLSMGPIMPCNRQTYILTGSSTI
jgi:hypothetical protein